MDYDNYPFEKTTDNRDTVDLKKEFILLRTLAGKVIKYSDKLLQQEIQIDGNPNYYWMILLFLQILPQYLEDIIKIIPSRTVELIARTMVEGYIKLKWVEKDPKARSDRWFNFMYFQEWKFMKREEIRGNKVDENKSLVEGKIKEFSKIHLNDEGQRNLEMGKEVNPFGNIKNDWTGKSMYDLAKETKLSDYYARFYDPNNDNLHWSPKGLLKTSEFVETEFSVSFRSYYQSNASIIAGIAAIIGSISIRNKAFGKSPTEEQLSLEKEFAPWNPFNY